MLTIYKYPLVITDSQTLLMPAGAVILSAQAQHDVICLWALVDGKQAEEGREIRIYGTGHPVEEDLHLNFIATVQTSGGALVWHVFEERK